MVKKFLFSTSPTWVSFPLRIPLGVIFIAHGAQKLLGWFGGPGLQGTAGFFEQAGLTPGIFWATLAACGEFFGGLLVLLGLATRFGALNIAIVMLVAIFKVHWPVFFAPNGFEYPMALLGSAIVLLTTGGGKLSVDAAISAKPGQTPSIQS
ncbi:MAG: DoxX family protein [candidate division Zixibacteria bacterium]|nr:DoxX family protein [candidate division Zixibacteria bacterium]